MFNSGKILSIFTAFILAVTLTSVPASAAPATNRDDAEATKKVRVEVPLNLAILVQDDLIQRVGNELEVTRQFIRQLPAGSRVMVGYITTGSLQVRQPFTDNLEQAAKALRVPIGSDTASPYNPYVEVVEALRRFDAQSQNHNAILLISDGLDVSHGFDISSAADTLDLHRAINEAQRRNVAVYSFYAPSVGLTSSNRLAASYGQSSLNRLSNETGGQAFFQGMTGFVTFEPYFDQLRRALNEQYVAAH